jgi:ribonuclease J
LEHLPLLSRIQQIIKVSEELGKKIVIDGRSMKNNVALAHELGYLKYKRGTIISYKEMGRYPDNKIVIACTGAQGEDKAVLMRIVNNEHREVKIQQGDTVVFSSSVIPGNERSVQKLRDALYKNHANVINYTMMDVHAGGHAKQEDIKLLIKLVNPKYYIPIYGTQTHIRLNAEVAEETGIPKENIFTPVNGQLLEISKKGVRIAESKLNLTNILVDGLGIGDVSEIVLRDRKQMMEHGMIVIISKVKTSTGEILGNPDIISRGFIYMNANKKLVEDIRSKVKEILATYDSINSDNQSYIKEKIRGDVTKFIYKRTHRNPMVLPVILLI